MIADTRRQVGVRGVLVLTLGLALVAALLWWLFAVDETAELPPPPPSAPAATEPVLEPTASELPSVSGRVVDRHTDRGVPGARVEVGCAGAEPMEAFADSRGAFELFDLPAGPCELAASSEGWLRGGPSSGGPAVVRVDPEASIRDVRLRLSLAGAITGRVVQGGRPIEGALLSLLHLDAEEESGPFGVSLDSLSDARGRFRIEGVLPSELQVMAEHERGFAESAPLRLDPGATRANLVLELEGEEVAQVGEPEPELSTGALFGRVLDERGVDLPAFRVRLLRTDGPPPSPQLSGAGVRQHILAQRGLRARSGAFREDGLEPGTYAVVVNARGYAPIRSEGHRVVAGRETDAGTLTLVGESILSGLVVDGSTGKPVFGARVTVESARAEGLRGFMGRAVTDREGRFRVHSVPLRRLTLRVQRRGFATRLVSGVEPVGGLELQLGRIEISPSDAPGRHFEYAGVGMVLGMKDGELVSGEVFEGAPASDLGLVPGTRIRAVDGVSTQGLTLHEAVELIRGEEGTDVELEVMLPGTNTVELVRVERRRVKR